MLTKIIAIIGILLVLGVTCGSVWVFSHFVNNHLAVNGIKQTVSKN